MVICFGDDDLALATDAFAGSVAVERHGGTLIGAGNVTRLYAEFCPWLLILPAGQQGVLNLLYWSGVSRTRTRALRIPEPFWSFRRMVEGGVDPLPWLADELARFGYPAPQSLEAPLSP